MVEGQEITGGFPAPPVNVWPTLIVPGDSATGPVQEKSEYRFPEPISWSDWPTAGAGCSETPISVDVCPLAVPAVAVKAPS